MSYQVKEALRLNFRDYVYFAKALIEKTASFSTSRSLILCNSYPKSGTHLLYQILYSMPGMKAWNYDILSSQSLSGFMNTYFHIKYKLESAPNNSIVRSHLMYYEELKSIIKQNNCKTLFIYRDLRDVAVSHARWVSREKLYYLNKIYQSKETFDERLMLSIRGIPRGTPFESNVSYPDIGLDFSRWKGWIDDPSTLSIKFEDLVGERGGGCETTRLQLIQKIADRIEIDLSEDVLGQFGSLKMNPRESHTYVLGGRGKVASWKDVFKENHKDAFKKVAGKLLVELGYEEDLNW